MKEVVFLTTERALEGFSLTGVRQTVANAEQAEETLHGILADSDVGVVAVEELLAEVIGEMRLKEMTRRWPGVMVTLPSPEPVSHGEVDVLQRMVRRALGYHVRLEA